MVVARGLRDARRGADALGELPVDLAAGAGALVEHRDAQPGSREPRRRGHPARAGPADADVRIQHLLGHRPPPRSTCIPARTGVVQERTLSPSTTTRHS